MPPRRGPASARESRTGGALRLATRGSALALAQARDVAGLLEDAEPGLVVELVTVRTSGDERPAAKRRAVSSEVRPGAPGDKSRFVKEIEEALLAGDADLAVHSAKDVPGELPDGLAIVGVPGRADPRDALCGATALDDLPRGARVGTSSLRRRALLLAAREDLHVDELRGNVDTRLRRLADGDFDAIVLARAGLERLRLAAGEPLPPAVMTPAAGQGCLALEARSDAGEVADLAARVSESSALIELTAERALTAALGADCHTPVGAHALLDAAPGGEAESPPTLSLEAFLGLPDGSAWIRDRVEGDAADPAALGRKAAERLLAAGAGDLLEAAQPGVGAARGAGTGTGFHR